MAHAATHPEIRNPGSYQIPGGLRILFIVFTVVGVAAFGLGLTIDARRTWFSFLQNHFFFLSLALGGIFFASVQWLTSSMWSAPVRRVSEALTAYLPVAMVMFIILYFGMHDLYVWTHPDHVKGDIVLEGKAGYLNQTFFLVRNLVAFALWIFFSRKMVGNSIAQDTRPGMLLTNRNRTLSPAFLLIFGVTYTMASFDQLMSLDPHWFSTMFGVYTFAGLFYSVLALITVLAIWLKNAGHLEGIVNDNHLHDLGKFMFAFTVFWAYIGFSQFMLIWYANLPEETGYFMNRFQGGWLYVSAFLALGKFATPFFLLLPRDAKRNQKMLVGVGLFMLFAHWVDLLWVTQPELYRDGPRIGWEELGVTLGFLGLFGLSISWFLSRNNVVAIGDPRLAEAVYHHHQ